MICESSEFYNLAKNVFIVCSVSIVLFGIFIFYPRKFKKKTISLKTVKTESIKGIKFFNIFGSIFFVIIIIFSAVLVEAKISIEVLNLKLAGGTILVMAFAGYVLLKVVFNIILINRIHNLIGCRVSDLPGDIGKVVSRGETVLIVFNSDKFEKEVELKRIYELCENIKLKKIHLFDINPLEKSGREIFDKFKLSDELVLLASQPRTAGSILKHPNYNKNPLSIVIISEMYIKEYWVGYEKCVEGLEEFKINRVGTVNNSTSEDKILNLISITIFIILFGIMYITSLRCESKFDGLLIFVLFAFATVFFLAILISKLRSAFR